MARSKQALRELAGLSKDPWRFLAPWTFKDRDELKWQNLKRTYEAGPQIAEEMRGYSAKLADDDSYSAEGRERLRREHFEQKVAPRFQELRDKILADLRAEARSAVALAEHEALKLPEHPFQIAASMRALDRVYKGVNSNGPKKLTLPKLEQLPPATLRAIAATDPIVSGLSDADHEVIRRRVFDQEGGVKLAQARELLSAVETAAEALDYSEAVAELYANIPNRSPEAERVSAMRDEIQQDRAPVDEVLTVVEPAA